MKRYRNIMMFAIAAAGGLLLAAHKVEVLPEQTAMNESEEVRLEKGYDLPIDETDKKEGESDCKNAMNIIGQLYKENAKGDSLNAVISDDVIEKMQKKMGGLGTSIVVSRHLFNMLNYEKTEDFLKKSLKKEKCNVVIYELHSDAGIGRLKFTFDGKDMYLLHTISRWDEKNNPIITTTSYTRVKDWKYTKKGWFCYELYVPEPPEVNEVTNGNVMIRVKPLKKEYLDIAQRYLFPVAYLGNNLFSSEWDADNMGKLDYNGLYESLYSMKYQKRLEQERYQEGIPKKKFEKVIMEYLPVTAEQLEMYAGYVPESQKYSWERLGCFNYSPNAFGTSIPEITGMTENEDGTVSIMVDAVCEMLYNDAVFSHELTVRFLENNKMEYISNLVLGEGLKSVPEYQYRLGGENEDSKKIAETYRDIYEKAMDENTMGSIEVTRNIVNRLGENGYAAVDMENQNQIDMVHPELVERFCMQVDEKRAAEVTFFSIMENGGFIRFDLETSEGEVYVTRSVLNWQGDVPEVDYKNFYPAYTWEYSESGYLFFEEFLPVGYDGAPGYTAIRVKPLDGKCRELNRRYILPIGYGANNMFILDWDEDDFNTLGFYDLFDIFYPLVYKRPIPYEKSVDGELYYVPEGEFEKAIMSYFKIGSETLKEKTKYIKQDQSYEYRTRGFYDCAWSPDAPYPEVVEYAENTDGTIKLEVNVVWPRENTAQAFCHEVVVRPLEDGSFQYVSNHVIPSEKNKEPTWYTEKLPND